MEQENLFREDEFRPGDLVFLTKAYEDYIKRKNPKLSISLVNRLAKIEEIIDWESDNGKKIKEAREKSGKWKNLIIEDNKYLLSIYYHDVDNKFNGKRGIIECTPMFLYQPGDNSKVFFEKVPDWVYEEIQRKCRNFDVKLVPVEKKPTVDDIEKQFQDEDKSVGGQLLKSLSKKGKNKGL
jgi:hypothetical protein